MEFRHLTAFITIAEELHFGRAAARLHLTQPSLSAQLQKLEKSLGVLLVARSSHEVKLTSAGKEFESQARLIVQQLEKAAHIAKSAAAGRSGTLSVGYNFPASRHVLPYALAKMSNEHPDVVVSLWEKRTGPQVSALSTGELDIALVYGHPHTSEFRHRRLLHRVPLVAVVGKGHPWAGRPGVPFAELANQSCVLFEREQCPAMYDSILAAAADNKIALRIAQTADDPGATAHMVSVKPLVGFASRHIGRNGSRRSQLGAREAARPRPCDRSLRRVACGRDQSGCCLISRMSRAVQRNESDGRHKSCRMIV